MPSVHNRTMARDVGREMSAGTPLTHLGRPQPKPPLSMSSRGAATVPLGLLESNGRFVVNLAANTDMLLELAKRRTAADREKLLLSLVELCDTRQSARVMSAAPIQKLLGTIFLSVVAEAERDIRARLAGKLADAAWAPAALVNVLALDDIEIARPIIAASPVLQDADLVRLLLEATLEHQVEVARRPKLGKTVVAEILRQSEPAVMTALAGNMGTPLSTDDMRMLVQASRRVAALRQPLARRPELTEDLAQRLYVWVGQTLRVALVSRFRLDEEALDKSLAAAINDAYGGHPMDVVRPPARVDAEREGMERRLVAKLQSAGQLRPGYLLRALREGKLSLFAAGLAALGGFEPEQVRRALESNRPELLALACAAVGIDRSVYPSILALVRQLNGGKPGGIAGPYGEYSAQSAGDAFRRAANAV